MPRQTDLFNRLIALALGVSVWGKPITDPDLGWHLFGGAWISRHAELPSLDPINLFNPVWHDYHWLGQVVLYGLFCMGGYALLRLVLGLIMAWLFLVVLDCCLIVSGSRRSSLLISLTLVLTAVFFAPVTSVRPQMAAILVVALAFRRMLQAQTAWELPYLALLTIILVNTHVYWVFVPFLWLVMRVLPALISDRGCKTRSVIGLLLLIMCGAISPYLGRSYVLVLDYLAMPAGLQSNIKELRSVFSMDILVIGAFLSYLLLYCRTFSSRAFRSEFVNHLLFIAGAALAMKHVKFLPLFAIYSIPVLLPACGEALRQFAPSIFEREIRPTRIAQLLLIAVASFVAIRDYPSNSLPDEVLHNRFPIEACRGIAKDARSLNIPQPVRVLTHFNNGGWCRFAALQQDPGLDLRVTTDGRTQEVPYDLYQRSFDLYGLAPGWRETLRIWDPDYALVVKAQPLSQALEILDPSAEIFEDRNFRVFRMRL